MRPRLVIAADTAPDRAGYARDVLGYERAPPTTATCWPTRMSTWCRSARRTVCTARSASPRRRPASPSGSRSRSAATPARPPRSPRPPRGRRGHLHRLQLPARPRGRARARADRGRRARPDHQRARGVPQRLRQRAQGRAVLALPAGPRRQRRHGRPAQPRRRPGAVRRRPDRRGHRPLDDRPRRTADPPMGSGTHFAVIEDGEMGAVENEDYGAVLARFAANSRGAARSAPWSAPGSSSGRSAGCPSRSTAPMARRAGTSSG